MPASAQAVFDPVVRIRLSPAIVRAFWSTERAWPGDTIVLCVETRRVPDGTPVAATVRAAALEPDSPVLATAEGVVTDNRCVLEHRVDWDDDAAAGSNLIGTLYTAGIKEWHQKSNGEVMPLDPPRECGRA
jgi:hypothetical protein